MRQRSAIWLAVACLAATAACGGGEKKAKASGPEVVAKDLSFKPAKVSVKLGGEVSWAFEDKGTSHNVTADDGSFRSENLAKGTFVHRFPKPGSFSYTCTIHPDKMKGTVDVRA
ncbi:MAG TPA: cupredoxin domain-containing protein [Acidimicrobiales bacterium]|nr:cupredoxin domain-containing protein [Acidimicrobiales bacterium]